MIKIDLNKDELIDMVCGAEPNFNLFETLKKYGDYNGSYGVWQWNKYELKKCEEKELYNIYRMCKDSFR